MASRRQNSFRRPPAWVRASGYFGLLFRFRVNRYDRYRTFCLCTDQHARDMELVYDFLRPVSRLTSPFFNLQSRIYDNTQFSTSSMSSTSSGHPSLSSISHVVVCEPSASSQLITTLEQSLVSSTSMSTQRNDSSSISTRTAPSERVHPVTACYSEPEEQP